MEKLLEQLLDLIADGRKSALCSVLDRSGSVPAPAGSRLLVRDDGSITGTVGGGALEGEVIHDAKRAIETDTPLVRAFDFSGESMAENLQICGGRITIHTDVVYPTDTEKQVTESVLTELRAGNSVALVSAVMDSYKGIPPHGQRLAFGRDGILAGGLAESAWNETVIKKAEHLFDSADPLYLELENSSAAAPAVKGFLVDFLHPAPTLVVFGGGHIGSPLAHLGAMCGFRVVVADDRAEYAAPERFPAALTTLSGSFDRIFDQLEIGPTHYLVSVTRCHSTDRQVVSRAVHTPAAYIGMIGSRRKVKLLWKELEAQGIERELLERVHTPVGIEIEAETPEEIAVSIIAQVIAVRRGRKPRILHETISLDS